MAVDLVDLVPSLQRAVDNPDTPLDATFTEEVMVGYLADGFWEARLQGLLAGYTEADGSIVTDNGGDDMPRELQQLVVFYGAIAIIANRLVRSNSVFRAKAGPVEFETQQSANLLRDILKDLYERRKYLIGKLSDLGSMEDAVFDAIMARTDGITYGSYWYPR